MVDQDQQVKAKEKRSYISQKEYPRNTLGEAIRVARVIADHYGGQAAEPLDVAASLNTQPTTGHFRTLTGAAMAFELTDGASYASHIGLTDLGRRIVMPTEEGDDEVAMREALLKPRVFREFLSQYDGRKLPPDNIMRNVLVKLGVPVDATEKAAELMFGSAQEAGVLQEIKGERFVRLRGATRVHVPGQVTEGSAAELDVVDVSDGEANGGGNGVVDITTPPPAAPQRVEAKVKPIFIGHGKKKGPLDKLMRVLDQFKIPYKVAVYEPHLGRPIPKKVKDIMSQCGSAILIFTADEQYKDAEGNDVWRPSENVIYELGAASFAYEDGIVIFMEEGLNFPTNFESIGHITFQEDAIEAKTMDLLKELVGFGLVKITPA